MNTQVIAQILWAIIGLPIIMYPMILVANIMSIAAPKAQKKTSLKDTLFRIFLMVTTVYPLIYYFCYKASIRCVEEDMLLNALLYAIPPLAIGGTLFWIIKKK